MKVKFILPALLEATDPGFRPIKYALFPPLGLASLAGYLRSGRRGDARGRARDGARPRRRAGPRRDVGLHHVGQAGLRARGPLPRAWRPRRARRPARDLAARRGRAARRHDLHRAGRGHLARLPGRPAARAPASRYVSERRTLVDAPPIRRDLIDRRRYLCPNSIVVSRGCPHHCDFCYKDAFFAGGNSFYTQAVDQALAEIERLPGRHLYFLDDHLLGNPRFAARAVRRDARDGPRLPGRQHGRRDPALRPDRARGRGRACAASSSASRPSTPANLAAPRQAPEPRTRLRRGRSAASTTSGSWSTRASCSGSTTTVPTCSTAPSSGRSRSSIETATFHIMTPYPGTALHDRVSAEGRITDHDWDHYDTRHVVYRPLRMTPDAAARRLLPRVPRLLCWGSIFARGVRPADRPSHGAPPRVRRRVEEVRAALGRRHPLAAGQRDAAAARGDARCVRAGTSRGRWARQRKLRASPDWGRPCACRGGPGRWHRTYRCRRSGRRRRAAARRRDGGQGPRPRGGHRRPQHA